MPGTLGAALELMLSTRALVRFRRSGNRRPDGEEKDFVPLAGAFPHKMKVAVRTAEQDAHSVHLRLDRRGPGGILKSAWPGLMREFTAHSHRVLR